MIRKIKRNISETATGKRCNRYGYGTTSTFKIQRAVIKSWIEGHFSIDEYLKHRVNRLDIVRAHNEEVARTGQGRYILA